MGARTKFAFLNIIRRWNNAIYQLVSACVSNLFVLLNLHCEACELFSESLLSNPLFNSSSVSADFRTRRSEILFVTRCALLFQSAKFVTRKSIFSRSRSHPFSSSLFSSNFFSHPFLATYLVYCREEKYSCHRLLTFSWPMDFAFDQEWNEESRKAIWIKNSIWDAINHLKTNNGVKISIRSLRRPNFVLPLFPFDVN